MHSFFYCVVLLVSHSFFSSSDWTLGTPGGTTTEAIQTNFQQWLSGPQNPGLIVLEHELTDGAVQAFQAAYPLMKQYNWTLQSTALLAGQSAYQNAADDTSPPTPVSLTAGGNGGAGLTTSVSSSSSSTPPTPTTSSGSGSKASAAPNSNSKKSGAAPGLNLSPVASLLSTLALVFSFYLI
jgi:chitin deacetylase